MSGRPRRRAPLAVAAISALLAAACNAPPTRALGQPPDELLRQARDLEAAGRFERALDLYDRALERDPDDPDALYLRANARYRAGRVTDSLADFDRFVELAPSREPYLWQRGIAQYQVGRGSECAEQFDVHRTVNPADVENAAWHFLCVARARGLDAARRELLPVGRDARVPMAQVYELFAGRAGRDEVLAAAGREPTPDARRLARFYARLYLGLFAEAGGDLETARREVREAVALGAGGFMADVARIHLEILDASGRAGSPPPGGSP